MFQDSAACGPESQDLWFSELASKVAKAKAICATCSVMDKCLQFAIDSDIEHGIFGGKTPAERKELVNVY
jgi:WhiB family redox-sensing transcriptional regulator